MKANLQRMYKLQQDILAIQQECTALGKDRATRIVTLMKMCWLYLKIVGMILRVKSTILIRKENKMKTKDNKVVSAGDEVYVIGSTGGIHATRVLPPVTSYELFGPVPVSMSFSTKKAAEAFRKELYKK